MFLFAGRVLRRRACEAVLADGLAVDVPQVFAGKTEMAVRTVRGEGDAALLTIEADGHRLSRAEVECVADVRGDDNAAELVDFSLHDVYNSFFVVCKIL